MARKSKVPSKSKGPKQKDFTKVKNKVGKKKQEKANEMKTDFKVKKVQMPAQNALEEKGEEVTHRKLGLSELLAHLQHHSSKVRRDALRGLLELCRDHPGVLNVNLSQILDSISLAATDGSADVRAALRSLQAFILDAMPQEALAAFGSTFALQVRSAISHVSGEVREDGLRLLELYLSRLGSKSVLTQGEASRLVSTLCQLHSHVDLVLPCLQQLLSSQGHAPPAESGHEVTMVAQVSLHDILDGKLQLTGLSNDDVVDSDIWEFCLRAWMQAGEMPRSAGGASASSGGWSRLRVAAVLEEGLTGILAGEKRAGSQPSAGQVATLSGIVRRQEWPIDVDDSSPFRPLADSINLRMARIMALLACGAAPIDAAPKHLQRLALASLAVMESVLLKSVSSFAAHAHQLGSTASATATASAAALAAMPTSAENEVKPFTSTGSLCHGLLVLDLLWCCVSNSEKLWHFSDVDVQHLAEITAAVASGTGRQVDELLPTAAAILAVPLTASLLGLRPEGGAMLRRAWPSALEMRSPPLAEVIEKLRPGTLTSWVTSWPKMLWYLGSSHPKLSSFLMAIILKQGKAAESGSLHEKLLAAVLPLLVPFIAGMPGDQSVPPLAKLQDEGLQQMAAAMLFHFPRLRVSLVKAITDSVCRWSVAATGTVAGLGDSCCELMLEAVLQDRGQRSEDCNDELLIARLRASFSVLQLSPKSPSAELSTLKLCNVIAAWVMEDVAETYNSPFVDLQRPVSGYSLDQRRYLAFQHVAWPLCRQLAASENSEMARRALCFFYLCARRLPGPTSSSKSGDDGSAFSSHISFLREVYRTLGQHALQSSPVFRELLQGEQRNVDLSDARGGACLLVKAWMNATSSPDLAYELLVRLCVEQLAAEKGAGFVSAAWVLVELVTYRNSHGLCHDSWGCHPLGFNDVISREDLRQRVRDVMTSAQGQVVEHTLALLPLL